VDCRAVRHLKSLKATTTPMCRRRSRAVSKERLQTVRTANEREKNEGDLAEEFLQHELMNETRAYIECGRRLQTLSNTEVGDIWVARFEHWFATQGNPRDMDDAAAEIRLRRLEIPYERVVKKLARFVLNWWRSIPKVFLPRRYIAKLTNSLRRETSPKIESCIAWPPI